MLATVVTFPGAGVVMAGLRTDGFVRVKWFSGARIRFAESCEELQLLQSCFEIRIKYYNIITLSEKAAIHLYIHYIHF